MVEDDEFDDYYLICFFIIKISERGELAHTFYKISESNIERKRNHLSSYVEGDDIMKTIQIKTITTSNLAKVLVALLLSTETINYHKFHFEDYDTEFYGDSINNFNCRRKLYSMKLHYLGNNNLIALSCINSGSTVQA